MSLLKAGDTIGIIALSNGLLHSQKKTIKDVEEILKQMGLIVVLPEKLYQNGAVAHATDVERAKMLMTYYEDKSIKAIFDVSGGDLANGVLPYLNYEVIKSNPKPFFGYSDLTPVMNALYHKTHQIAFLYQIRHIAQTKHLDVRYNVEQSLINGHSNLFDFQYEWIQGMKMKGYVIGGNIRCFLKLAGTPYLPPFEQNILFLESYSGDLAKISTYLNQYKQIGAFDKISGLVLGYFTELEDAGYSQTLIELVKTIVDDESVPIIKTKEIGHQVTSKCLIIGKLTTFIR